MLPQGRMFGRAILPDGTFQPLDSILVPATICISGFRRSAASCRRSYSAMPNCSVRERRAACASWRSPSLGARARQPGHRATRAPRRRPACARRSGPRRIRESEPHPQCHARRRLSPASEGRGDGARDRGDGVGRNSIIIADDLVTPRAVKAVAECDVVFGCMDGVGGASLSIASM